MTSVHCNSILDSRFNNNPVSVCSSISLCSNNFLSSSTCWLQVCSYSLQPFDFDATQLLTLPLPFDKQWELSSPCRCYSSRHCCAVNKLSQHVNTPTLQIWNGISVFSATLRGTSDYGLVLLFAPRMKGTATRTFTGDAQPLLAKTEVVSWQGPLSSDGTSSKLQFRDSWLNCLLLPYIFALPIFHPDCLFFPLLSS